ncbi:MAG: family 16 glycoside hydrolase [Verrucomicrobiales bacterium]
MKRSLKSFRAMSLAIIFPGLAIAERAVYSMEEFNESLKKIHFYKATQSPDPLNAVAAMAKAVADDPPRRRSFAASMAAELGTGASLDCKVFLCRQLALFGSDDEVAMIGPLLRQADLSDMARYALEGIRGPKAKEALRTALGSASGNTTIGLINSLAVLADREAVPVLSDLANGPDAPVASAAVAALGRIAGADAEKVLEALQLTATGRLLDDVYDAYLLCADRLASGNERTHSLEMCRKVYANATSPAIRGLALRGMTNASGAEAVTLLLKVLQSGDAAMQEVALSLIGGIQGESATLSMTRLLPDLPPGLQVGVLIMLGRREDRAALSGVLQAASSADESVQVAALNTLGDIGDATIVRFLAQTAARSASAANRAANRAARESLYRIKGDGVDAQIVAALPESEPQIKVELLQAVARRTLVMAVPTLLKSATDADPDVRLSSLKALRAVARGASTPALVDLLIHAKTDAERSEAVTALIAAARRISNPADQPNAIHAIYPSVGDSAAKVALITVLGGLGNDRSLPLLEAALASPDQDVARATVKALAQWPNPSPLPLLRDRARTSDDDVMRWLALSGFIRLCGLDEGRDGGETLMHYREALKLSTRPAERIAVLSGLARVRTLESLKLAAACLQEEPIRNEAAIAVAKIACPQDGMDDGLRGEEVLAALILAVGVIRHPGEREKMQDYLSSMLEDESGFVSLFNGRDLTGWDGSGWTVEDGIMVCHGGVLTYTKQPFSNFILRFEVKLSPGANNGLNFRSRNSHWNEIQILDETHPRYATIHDYQAPGSLYGVVAARRGVSKPVGEWNSQEVMADGTHIKVTLNGIVVADADLSQLNLDNCLDGSAHPGLRDPSGDLGWLGHANAEEKDSPVYIRNVRIKTLP